MTHKERNDQDSQTSSCRLCETVSSLTSEDAVIETLSQSCNQLGFDRGRFYDANKCPFDHIHFFTLRTATGQHPNAPLGYSIYEATLSDSAVINRLPVWEDSNSPTVQASPAKRQWVSDLGLEGRVWIDVPVFAAQQLVGLWALDREGKQHPSDDELADIKRISLVAGLKIHELRQARLAELTQKLLLHCDNQTPYADIVRAGCTEVARVLGASFVAFFAYDRVHGRLNKVVEVYNDQNSIEPVTFKGDTSYTLGNCLTGMACVDEELQYIPDFDKLLTKHPELVDQSSRSYHETLMRRPVRSVIYQLVTIPAGWPGFLRAMNRSEHPHLRFTGEHKGALGSVAQSLGHTLAVRESVDRLTSIWDAFSLSLARLKKEGLDYSSISTAATKLGYPIMIVTVWREDGILADVWCNKEDFHQAFRALVGKCTSSAFAGGTIAGTTETNSFPPEITKILRAHNVTQTYVVKSEPIGTQRTYSEAIATVFPLSYSSPAPWLDPAAPLSKASDQLPQFMILDVLGKLAASSHELARNRALLYLAEQAIGTIAHEINSPTSSLVNLAKLVCQHERDIFSQLPKDAQIVTKTLEAKDSGELETVSLVGPAKNIEWLEVKAQSITQHSKVVRKVVNDALRWVRMGGKFVELDMKPVNLHALIKDCVYELREDIAAKPPLTVELSEALAKVPPFVADPILLHHLFINLLDNAVKYTHTRGHGYETKVKVTAERQIALVDIRINNWGLGIDKADYENIFTGFYRSSIRDRVHTVRGVGLGLSTCRRIVELHSGQMSVDSVPTLDDPERTKAMEGHSTTFTVRLPLTLKEGRVDIDTATLKHRGDRT